MLDYSGGSLHEAFAPRLSDVENVFAAEGEVDPDAAAAQRNALAYLFNVGIVGAHVTKQVNESVGFSSTHDWTDRRMDGFGRAVNDPGLSTEAEIDHDTHGRKSKASGSKDCHRFVICPASTGKQ